MDTIEGPRAPAVKLTARRSTSLSPAGPGPTQARAADLDSDS